MNLLFTVHYPVYGGPHSQAERLNKPLARKNWHTVVLLPDEPGNAAQRLRSFGVEVVEMPLHRLRARLDPRMHFAFGVNLPPDVMRIRRLIKEREIDLVVANGLVNPHAAIAAHLERVPVVWQILDTRLPMALRYLLMPLVSSLADCIMVWGNQLVKVHPGAERLRDRLVVCMPAVDTDVFRPNPVARSKARLAFGFSQSDVVIGNVGNLNPQKGHQNFIQAAAILRKSHPDTRFLILGATYPQHMSYTNSLWRLAESLGLRLGSDLIVRDPGDQVARLAQALDIFWLTSEPLSEGIPTVVPEAMALGLPVVSADVGAVREAMEVGVSGFVVPPRDPKAIASTTDMLLKSSEVRSQLGYEARRQAIKRNSLDACVDAQLRAFDIAMFQAKRRSGKAA